MNNMRDKVVRVDEETHRYIRIQSVQAGMTMGEWVKGLVMGVASPLAAMERATTDDPLLDVDGPPDYTLEEELIGNDIEGGTNA